MTFLGGQKAGFLEKHRSRIKINIRLYSGVKRMLRELIYWSVVYFFFFGSIFWFYNSYKFLVGRYYLPGPEITGFQFIRHAPIILIFMLLPVICGLGILYLLTILFSPERVSQLIIWKLLILSISIPIVITCLVALVVSLLRFQFNLRSLCYISLMLSLTMAVPYLLSHLNNYTTLPSVLQLFTEFLLVPTIFTILISIKHGEKKLNRIHNMMFQGRRGRHKNEDQIEW